MVDLDRQADEPIDLFVNGTRFATGRLVVADGTDWAVEIERSSATSRRPLSAFDVQAHARRPMT